MTTTVHVKARITPWDDPAFVRAFELARAEVDRSGCRTVEEALEHTSHWTVNRDA